MSYMPELGEMGCKTEMTYNGIETEICVCHSMLCNSAAYLIDDVNFVLLFGTTAIGLFVANHKFERLTYTEAIDILRNSKPFKKKKFKWKCA